MPTTPSPGPHAPVSAGADAAEQRRHAPAIEHMRAEPEGAAVPDSTVRPNAPSMAAMNPFVRLLLRSPLHAVLSDTLLLLTYTGRTSGRRYTIPMAYSRVGDVITVFTLHTWWKNLRGGASMAGPRRSATITQSSPRHCGRTCASIPEWREFTTSRWTPMVSLT